MTGINPNLFFSLLAASVTAFLGILVWMHDRKNVTNLIFVIHAFVGTVWAVANYISLIAPPDSILFWIRMVIFFAVPHVFLFLLFVLNFPENSLKIKSSVFDLVLVLMITMMLFTLTPLVFREVTAVDGGFVPVPGVMMPFFGPTLIISFLLTAFLVVKKYIQADKYKNKLIKWQWAAIGTGLLVAYTFLIFLVFVRVIFFNETTYVPYSPLFILPIFIGASYAIFRHQLFNIKVVATELLVFALLLVGFIQVFLTESTLTLGLGVAVVIFILITGVLLIRSVLREIKQREQMQVLTKKLETANKQLKTLDQARVEFISMASHQLRTPPSSIKWYLAAVLNNEFGQISDELRDSLIKINLTNNSQISLIDALLNVSRIERGKLEFVFEEADLVAITEFTVDQLTPLAKDKGLKMTFIKPSSPVPKILMDKEKLRQVINNMIDNSIKYTKKGSIEVSIAVTGKDVILRVKDTGKGLNEKEFEAAFAKYGRGKDSIKYSAGLGLGMYLAKVIVEQHNGKIWADSPGVDKGSTFTFSLPIKNQIKPTSLIFDLTKTQNVK